MKGKRGLSTIVITAIMIGLVLVAVGVVWVVVNNIIAGGTEDAGYTAKCIELDLEINSVTCSSTCTVVVKRNAGTGSSEIGGVNVVIANDAGESQVTEKVGNIAVLASSSFASIAMPTSPTKAEVVAYFIKENGDKHICSGTSKFSGTIQ